MQLKIEAVHQPERLKLVFGQLARQPAGDLTGELLHPFVNELRVEFVIAVHIWSGRFDDDIKHGTGPPVCRDWGLRWGRRRE